MKRITPIEIWENGDILKAELLNLKVIYDDLKESANFYYSLLTIDGNLVTEGNIIIDWEDYVKYNTNEDAYNFAIFKLKLVSLGDYILP